VDSRGQPVSAAFQFLQTRAARAQE
jgi:hypothetical protein